MTSVFKISSNICALGVILLSVMGLLGYLPGLGLLASIRKDYIPMAPATAVGFMILGGGSPGSKRETPFPKKNHSSVGPDAHGISFRVNGYDGVSDGD
jgi:hypothetical protein